MLILKIVEAIHFDNSHVKTTYCPANHIHDFALQKLMAIRLLQNFRTGFRRILVGIANSTAYLFATGEHAANTILLNLLAVRRITRYRCATTHFYGLDSGTSHCPLGTDRFKLASITFYFQYDHRRCCHAA